MRRKHQLLRHTIREFAQQEMAPRNREIEETHTVPVELRQQLAELGFIGAPFPTKYGGPGAGETGYCILMEELNGYSPSVAVLAGEPGEVAAVLLHELESRGLALRAQHDRERLGAFSCAALHK